jgi:HAD superfamily hydrolase (TIGR01509 family)
MRPATLALPTQGMLQIFRPAHDCADRHMPLPAQPTWRVHGFVFEASNVLYDDTAWRRWIFRLLSSMGLHTNYASFFRVWDDEYLPAVHRGERNFDAAFARFLSAVGLNTAQIQEVEIAARPRRDALEQSARPLPGVLPTLERLGASGARLAVLSDSALSSQQLSSKLAQMGLGNLIQHCRSSIDLHATKPSPTCYGAILDDLGLEASDVAFVGHRHDELAGAAACGLRTVAFNWDADAEADCYLENFASLAEQTAQQRRAA